MAHESFIVGDPVDVRSRGDQPWRPGVVAEVMDKYYCVDLNTPITADVWSGTARRYGGGETLQRVCVYKVCSDLTDNAHQIRAQV